MFMALGKNWPKLTKIRPSKSEFMGVKINSVNTRPTNVLKMSSEYCYADNFIKYLELLCDVLYNLALFSLTKQNDILTIKLCTRAVL